MFVTPELPQNEELIIKKSRFIGHVVPVKSVEDAESALDGIRLAHKNASHNCYAYTVGLGVPVERFSDDGEPSGTAGRPILEVLRRRPVSNALVVVTRYFGGTLLGASGLVRAYAESTAAVLEKAAVLHCRLMQRVVIQADYGRYGKLEYELTQLGHALLDKEFSAAVQFTLWVVVEETEPLLESVANWSNGQVETQVSPPEYVGVRQDGSFVYEVWPSGNERNK